MFMKNLILPGILATALLGVTPAAFAENSHSHDGQGTASVSLRLNDGKKWQGDDFMLTGMDGIRTAMAAQLEKIHQNKLQGADYIILAGSLEKEIDHMVENCKLSPEVDEQLHVVLEQVIEGIDDMQTGAHPRSGAVKIVQALNAYGKHFEHPGWKSLEK
ncbi:hypothetical protein [Magnetovibrio blakemorei]|uniref:DnrO protein n=1 Tax=Magnetovibrio blakemorei TaxID=28181 RepID=A0A1E5Q8M1_9PROT|nr:hypothetical protein [Magnetovibrio blakemorei]OEJ67726.1 hypothetical protein BEN30_08315 [Magnetovibrio blakemorei]